MDDKLIISILSFVLNSVLLSGFIIPQVQKLKEIKDQLVKFKLTFVPKIGSIPPNIKSKEEKQNEEVVSLQNLLDIYRIRSKELELLIEKFRLAIWLAILAIVCAGVWLKYTNLVLVSHAFLQFVILLFAIKTYAVSPDRLQSVSYLVSELDINPHVLINALDLNISVDTGKSLFSRIKREDPLKINLTPKMRIWGFRFLLLISGKDDNTYYVSYGPITAKTQIWRHLVPPHELFKRTEYNRIEIGSFSFNLIEQGQKLDIKFLIFLPFFKHEESAPFIMEGIFEVRGKESETFTTSSSLGAWSITTTRTYGDIKFKGEGIELYKFNLLKKDSNILNKVVNKLYTDLIKTKTIKQFQSLEGKLLSNL